MDSSVSTTSAHFAILSALDAFVYGEDTDVTAVAGSLVASQNSQITWAGGEVSGSIWADTASQVTSSATIRR